MKFRIVLPIAYVVVFVTSLIFMFQHAKETAFCGLFAVLLTVPWSLAAAGVCGLLGYSPAAVAEVFIMTISALLNGYILYRIGVVMDE